MGQEIVYCSRCQSRLNGADFDRGAAVRISNYIYCTGCLTPEEKKLVESLTRPPDPQHPIRRSSPLKAASASSGAIPAVPRSHAEPAPKPARRNPLILIAAGAGLLVVLILIIVVIAKSGGEKKVVVEVPPEPPRPPAWSLAAEFEGLKTELNAPLSQKNFRVAQAVLDRAKSQHGDVRWVQSVADLEQEVAQQARGRFKEIREAATRATDRKPLEELREEIVRWGPAFESQLKEFDAAFGAALAAVPAPPEPPKPPPTPKPEEPLPPAPKPTDPDPVLIADPQRSEAGRKYLASWQKAMGLASRHDYEAAATELKAAARDFKEDDVQKEIAADLKDLARMQVLRGDLLKEMAALPSWTDVALDVAREDGTRGTVRGQVLQANARRLELRGEPRYVELEDISPGSLLKPFLRKKSALPPEDVRLLALLCAIDGDEAAATGALQGNAELLPPKIRNYCTSLQGKPPVSDEAVRKNEWAARKLYYQAEAEFRVLETRAAALEKYDSLLGAHSSTAFVKANKSEIAARREESKDYTFTALRVKGKGLFSLQKLPVTSAKEKVEMFGWKTKEEPAADDANTYVEVSFFALPETEYKGWALIGGCCATTFTWYLQASDLTYVDKKTRKTLNCDPGSNFAAPWDHRIPKLSTTHGGKNHAKADKEPSQWEWVELPMPKYPAGGVKSFRFMAGSKGMALGAVLISAINPRKPTFEETKKLAEASADEGVPAAMLKVGKGEPDLLPQIPEARPMVLVYDLDLSRLSKPVKYDADHHAEITRPFDRIAYLLELQRGTAPGQFVFVSMDAFTEDANKIGIPGVATGARFQMKVTSMNVHTNVEALAAGIGLDGGNIEFWPNNYGPANGANIPGASGTTFDFGDQIGEPTDGYGCMQVHNHKAAQTIFAINHWQDGGGGADLGIGNSPAGNPDWTFTRSAGSYSFKRLRVLVRPKG